MILQVASLRYNVIFKKAFSDVEIFKGFVRDLLGIHLDIDKVETEKAFSPTIGTVERPALICTPKTKRTA